MSDILPISDAVPSVPHHSGCQIHPHRLCDTDRTGQCTPDIPVPAAHSAAGSHTADCGTVPPAPGTPELFLPGSGRYFPVYPEFHPRLPVQYPGNYHQTADCLNPTSTSTAGIFVRFKTTRFGLAFTPRFTNPTPSSCSLIFCAISYFNPDRS